MDGAEGKKEAYRKLEKERVRLLGQIDDLSQESAEHTLVLKTLSTLPDDRRCYRIMGRVAVERTVAEVNEVRKETEERLKFVNEEVAKLTKVLTAPLDTA
ncbi:putative KE2 family protein [Babesia divergens]|uniref:KE2 family protein n=1 Tax=Babesia divergens TaxID=32595 RepID=A0AAD9G928_BABDI|nr:putative KE2 family protein [Babesia divergens]